MPDLAAHLVRSGALPAESAARALAAAQDGDVASAALRLGLVSESNLVRVMAEVHGCPGVDLSRSVIPVANLDVVSHAFCRQRRIVPVSVGKAEVVLAMADPEDYALADELRFVTGRKVLRYVAVPASIERAIDGLAREKQKLSPAWHGAEAPALPDPSAAWVGVVHPPRQVGEVVEVPEATNTSMQLELTAEPLETPFAAPSPARRVRPSELRPAPGPGAAPAAPATVRLEGVGAGRLALVADPASEARHELGELLARLACTVLQASNGKATLDIVREARPDLVIMEALLPMVQGFEVCRAIKGDPVLRPTRVILTSGVHRGTVAADAQIAFGADAFLEKPFRRDETLRIAKVLLLGGQEDPADLAKREAARSLWRTGAQLLKEGRLEEATVRLRDACARDDLSAEAHYYLGHTLARQGLLFEAAAAYARSSELRPDVDAAHQYLAQTYEQLGFQKSAREAWARAIEACSDEKRRPAMQARLMKLLGL
jgi:CheY-like chemotaxis protein